MTLSAQVLIKVGKLVRLLGSDQPGELVAAVQALRRTLESAGSDLHNLAASIERGLDGHGYGSQDLEEAFLAGLEEGRKQGQASRPAPQVRTWHAVAMWLSRRLDRLDSKHHDFIRHMVDLMEHREPTMKQAGYLKGLFVRLGGDPHSAPETWDDVAA